MAQGKTFKVYVGAEEIPCPQQKSEVIQLISNMPNEVKAVARIELVGNVNGEAQDITESFESVINSYKYPNQHTCKNCGSIYGTKRKDSAGYCSRSCRDEFLKREQWLRKRPKCPICGKDLEQFQRVYCSSECSRLGALEYSKKYRADKKGETYSPKNKKPKKTLAEIQKEALERGMTVGQYMALEQVNEMRRKGFWGNEA